MRVSSLASFSSLVFSSVLAAQCPLPTSVSPPNLVPVSAGTWSIQHLGQPLVPGQIEYVVISLPAPTPIPFSALPWLFCNTVGNTPCLYVELNAVSWFNIGPSPGQNATVSVVWPNNPALVGQVLHEQVVPIELGATGNIVAVTATNRLTLTIGAF